ncbi:hypothetical protein L5515_011881 [Caenorhabditis briggsae]|uniref:Uncharacterized protein n=1 Tax=Caenorhabditis briggsae TaxID=6238 RepID=A0AAE9JF25_CAEBR|nr:hypothetical protein L5515_011881 [Caenorhabditis briggsae]
MLVKVTNCTSSFENSPDLLMTSFPMSRDKKSQDVEHVISALEVERLVNLIDFFGIPLYFYFLVFGLPFSVHRLSVVRPSSVSSSDYHVSASTFC